MTKIVFLVTLTTKFLYIIDYKSNFSIIYSTKHQFFNKRVIQKGRQTLKDVYLQKKMNRAILKLAIPNIISNITIPLLGLVDMILMGHLGSAIYIGAISLGGTIFSV